MERLLGNGRPGLIDGLRLDIVGLRTDFAAVKDLALKARYVFLGCFVALMLMLGLTGSGTVSLKALIAALKP